MATEKLKVFVNTASTVSSSAITNVAIKTTSSSEQAVIKNITYEATDPEYPVTATLTNGNASLSTPKTTAKTVKNSDNLSGSQIVDVNSTVNLTFDTGADIPGIGYQDARYFSIDQSTIIKFADATTASRGSTATTFATLGTFADSNSGSGQTTSANSAFGWINADGTKQYARVFSGDMYVFNEDGSAATPASYSNIPSGVHGGCTDGTYFYFKHQSSNATLGRVKIGTDTAINITTDVEFSGQSAGNQSSFVLYADGFVYSKYESVSTVVYKTNVTSGATTSISNSLLNVGTYSAGAITTKGVDGVFYLIEVGGYGANKAYVINLSTEVVTQITCASLATSTEYGNLGLEVAPGLGLFFYNNTFIWIDANTMTGASATATAASVGFDGQSITSGGNGSSFAGIPIHTTVAGSKARAVTHKVYADGVLIEGVA